MRSPMGMSINLKILLMINNLVPLHSETQSGTKPIVMKNRGDGLYHFVAAFSIGRVFLLGGIHFDPIC